MSTSPATPHPAKSPRFFALTSDRVEAVVKHGLTRAELLVWAHVELHARPRCPVAFTLEGVAARLELGVASVRRAVRRLLQVRLLVGLFEGNRYRLAPAGGAFDQAGENLPEREGSPARSPQRTAGPADVRSAENLPPEEGVAGENLPEREGGEPEEARHDEAGDLPQSLKAPENLKQSFACALTRELCAEWGLYRAVAERLVATHGRERVGQVLAWGRFLKAAGKLKSRGWAYQALVRGWEAPDGFHTARHAGQEAPSKPAQVSQDPPSAPAPTDEPLDEAARVATLRDLYAKPLPAMRRMAVKLATDWGIPLEAFGAHAV